MFAEIQDAMRRLFSDLTLNNLVIASKIESKGPTFDKGTSRNLPYKNLSGGEKAAFDLLFDIFLKRVEYDNTVFCIDEPEAHMNPRLQGKLLEELFHLVNHESQLWIATHAIGMMRKALQLHEKLKDQVVFLDFTDGDFDGAEVIKPTTPNRRFWEQTHEIALDDLAALVAPNQIVICEGRQGAEGFDAECYNQIFSEEFPDTKFVSAGGKRDLQNYISVVEAVAKGAKVVGLRDHDENITPREIRELLRKGIKVLKRAKIENYLLSDDVLMELCQDKRLEPSNEKAAELIKLRDSFPDIKKVPYQIRNKVVEWGAS
ncbi:AAA family ATPase, partial [Candidatus Poribacteria bacterium]|nr:AAA family ATPase [Candidatus Poribacteria bacterium]